MLSVRPFFTNDATAVSVPSRWFPMKLAARLIAAETAFMPSAGSASPTTSSSRGDVREPQHSAGMDDAERIGDPRPIGISETTRSGPRSVTVNSIEP